MRPKGNAALGRWLAALACVLLAGLATACSDGTPSAPAAAGPPGSDPGVDGTPGPGPAGSHVPVLPLLEPDPTPAAAPDRALREGRYEAAALGFAERARSATGDARAQALLGQAQALDGAGDTAGALEALEAAAAAASPGSRVAVQTGYALGVRLVGAGRSSEAVPVLRRLLDGARGPLAPYAAAELARAERRAGDAAAARIRWDGLLAATGTPRALRQLAYHELAAMAVEAGDVGTYVRVVEGALAEGDDAGLRYQLARVLRDGGDTAAANAALREILLRHRDSRYALLAVDELEAAGETVDPAIVGYIRYRRGDLVGAIAALSSVVAADADAGASGPGPAFAAYYYAAALDDSGQLAPALAAYDRVVAIDAGSDLAHRAAYWAARVLEKAGDAPAASGRYVALVTSGPRGQFTAESAFRAGYVLARAGDPAGAVAAWAATDGAGDARQSYWLGRALRSAGDTAGGEAAFRAAIARGPLDFWGLEAAVALGERQPVDISYRERVLDREPDWDAVAAWLTGLAGGEPLPLPENPAADLVAVGLRDEAGAALRALATGPWETFAALREAQRLGLTRETATLAVRLRNLVGVASHDAPAEVMRLAYPLDYVALLDYEAKLNGVDPLFLAALIRLESLWDPAAVSVADARGLTQVIPPTGEAIARSLGVPGFRVADLHRPAVSLRFGTWYFAQHLRRFGSAHQALAAYNGGSGNVPRWTEAAGGPSVADFVEAVDFAETSAYVRVVLEYYAHYLAGWAE